MRKILLAALVLLAVPASANAATTVVVNDQNDASLESGATTCESTDAGKCTLRAAVELADADSGETTIELPEGTYAETLPGSIVVEPDTRVTIVGAGAGTTFIKGEGDSFSVLAVRAHGSLTLEKATVEDGGEFQGGGIWAEWGSYLAVRQAKLTENDAYEGGAIFGEEDSSVLIEESSIVGNYADFGGGVDIQTLDDDCDYAKAAHAHASAAPQESLGSLETTLTVVRSTIAQNTAEQGNGGGINIAPEFCEYDAIKSAAKAAVEDYEDYSNVLIEQSTIAGNRAESGDDGDEETGFGGGIFEDFNYGDPIVDSTIADNFATENGGGLYTAEGGEQLISDTVAENMIEPRQQIEARPDDAKPAAVAGEEAPGGNLASYPGDDDGPFYGWIELRNTIVAENPDNGLDNCSGYVEGALEEVAGGYNLDYPSTSVPDENFDTCGMSTADDDLVGVDPKLDPKGLQSNGGPTQTIALTAESPAIGYVPIAGDCEDEGIGPALEVGAGKSSPVDQRGEPRPGIKGKECDIGAYEYQETPAKTEPVAAKTETPAAKTETPAAKSEVLGVKITSPVQCASKRDIVIHIQNVKQFGIVSAVVSIDGKHRRTLQGRQLSTSIDLVGLPKGTFTVEIAAKTRSGQTLHGERVYHTCHTKLPGHKYLKL